LGMNPGFWNGRRVLITGHTGFKGAWLAAWLHGLGANVTGYAQEPETDPNLWSLLGLSGVRSIIGELDDRAALQSALNAAKPEVIFHLAAQSLVRRSYRQPVETFATNVLGSVTLLDLVRQTGGVRCAVMAEFSEKRCERCSSDQDDVDCVFSSTMSLMALRAISVWSSSSTTRSKRSGSSSETRSSTVSVGKRWR